MKMKKILIGKKLGMTQYFQEDGGAVPITVVEIEKACVLAHKTLEKNGYNAIVVGYTELKEGSNKLNKPQKGYFKSLNAKLFRHIKEFRVNNLDQFPVNVDLDPGVFEMNESVHIKAKTKGKKFCGVVKRHNFKIGPKSHGSKSHRIPGSIGGGTTPGKVLKGTKMAGRKGNKHVTLKNIEVLQIKLEEGLLYLKGSLPGNKKHILTMFN